METVYCNIAESAALPLDCLSTFGQTTWQREENEERQKEKKAKIETTLIDPEEVLPPSFFDAERDASRPDFQYKGYAVTIARHRRRGRRFAFG